MAAFAMCDEVRIFLCRRALCRQSWHQKQSSRQCQAKVEVHVRLASGRATLLIFIRVFSDSFQSKPYHLDICHYSVNMFFHPFRHGSATRCGRCSGCVPFDGLWLVDLHTYCRRFFSHDLHVHRGPTHLPLCMYVEVEVSPSISHLPCLPDAYSMAWGFHALSCDLKCIYDWASRFVGCPFRIS